MFDELRAIQREYGYLPPEQLKALSVSLNTPLSRIHAVASFYPHFHLVPPPRCDVRVCADMSCHLLGGDEVKADLDAAFRGAGPQEVSIREVSCLGRCDSAPAIAVNDDIYPLTSSHDAIGMVRDVLGGPSATRTTCQRGASSSSLRSLQRNRPLHCGSPLHGESELAGHHCRAQGQQIARHGRRRISHRLEVGDRAQRARCDQIHRLQRRRERARHHQRPPHHGEPAASGGRRHDHGRPGHRRAQGHSLYPSRVRSAPKKFCRKKSIAAIATAFLARKYSAAICRSIWKSSSAPVATSAAKRARCWKRSRASAPSRATSRRSPAPTACGISQPSSTTSRRLPSRR